MVRAEPGVSHSPQYAMLPMQLRPQTSSGLPALGGALALDKWSGCYPASIFGTFQWKGAFVAQRTKAAVSLNYGREQGAVHTKKASKVHAAALPSVAYSFSKLLTAAG